MLKHSLTISCIVLFAGMLKAEDTTHVQLGWKLDGFFQQNLNQVSFTNWASGGENAFASTSLARFNANYKSEDYQWENFIDLAYGIIRIEDTPSRKNEDRIELFSKAGKIINEQFSYSAFVNFQSQFDKAYETAENQEVISKFMAPAYVTLALGIDYQPTEFISIFLSPTTGKFTFVLDQDLANQGRYGVKAAELDEDGTIITPGKNVNPEFGALLRIVFDKEVLKNVHINSRITFFNNYTDEDVNNRKNTDIDWLTSISMPINRYITASLGFHLLYDDDIKIPVFEEINGESVVVRERATTQFKQTLGIGLVYSF